MAKLLVIGGSGYLGRRVLATLAERYTVRLFDLNPVDFLPDGAVEYVEGSVTDPDALQRASEGMDLLLYMAMGRVGEFGINDVCTSYDVNVMGVHLAMEAAAKAEIKRAVYTSSLSVHDGSDLLSGAFDSEEVPPEPRTVYGHTKWLGEQACRFVQRVHGIPILALRLFHPIAEEKWRERHENETADGHTRASDVARALIAALELEHAGFDAIHVTGDTSGKAYRHEKAKRILGWEPSKPGSEGE